MCMYIYTHICVYVYIHIYICVCIYIHIYYMPYDQIRLGLGLYN
jgi:hypothetical protein